MRIPPKKPPPMVTAKFSSRFIYTQYMHRPLFMPCVQRIYNKIHIIYVMRAHTELRKNISIDQKTWERLKSFGRFGDSFDSLLNRLMDTVADKTDKSKK